MSLAVFLMLAVATAADPDGGVAPPQAAALPAGPVEIEGRPLRVAALDRGPTMDVLLLRGPELERLRLDGDRLSRTGAFRAPSADSRPLLLDAAPDPAGGDPLVTVVFGEDLRSVDQGADTRLHAFVLSADGNGGFRRLSADLGAWLRIVGGGVYLQRRGADELAGGPVRRLEGAPGDHRPGARVPWGMRWLLDATPLPGGVEALAWDGDLPVVVKLEGGARVKGGATLGDLGSVREPAVAIRLDRPIFRGLDREGGTKDQWRPVPRRVVVAANGAPYTVLRERSRSFLGRTSGQDAVVRLDWSGGALSVSRPFPGVDAFAIDFAIVERPGGRRVALLLVNEKEDGSGRAHLVFQGSPRDRPPAAGGGGG